MVDTESLVPPGHLLRQMDAAVEFEKLYEIVEPLYSEEGRRSIDPVVWFRAVPRNHEKRSAVQESQGRAAVLDGRRPACVLRLALRSLPLFPFFSLFLGTALMPESRCAFL